MLNFVDVKFKTNKFFLMAQLLTNIENIKEKLNSRILEKQKEKFIEQYEEFERLANKFPELKSLIHTEETFEKLQNNRMLQKKYNESINKKIDSFANIETMEELEKSNNAEYVQSFETLFDTEFFKGMYKLSDEYAKEMEQHFNTMVTPDNNSLQDIIGETKTKKVEFMTLPPQILEKIPSYIPSSEKNGNYKAAIAMPKEIDLLITKKFGNIAKGNIKSFKDVIILHEITHTEIPVPDKSQFKNKTQYNIYNKINHSLVELANDCEMSVQLCGLPSYFLTPMHSEKIVDEFDRTMKIPDLEKQGIKCDKLNFESKTKDVLGKTVITLKDELGNDKIRGMIYPYFLMYKNNKKENAIEETLKEIKRDSKMIEEIYGGQFLNQMIDKENIKDIYETVKDVHSLQNLNDIIAEKIFSITREKVIHSEKIMEEKNDITEKEQSKKLIEMYKDEGIKQTDLEKEYSILENQKNNNKDINNDDKTIGDD